MLQATSSLFIPQLLRSRSKHQTVLTAGPIVGPPRAHTVQRRKQHNQTILISICVIHRNQCELHWFAPHHLVVITITRTFWCRTRRSIVRSLSSFTRCRFTFSINAARCRASTRRAARIDCICSIVVFQLNFTHTPTLSPQAMEWGDCRLNNCTNK